MEQARERGIVFRAELPQSAVLVAAAKKGEGEQLFTDAPIDDVGYTRDIQEGPVDEKDMSGCFQTRPLIRETPPLILNPDRDQ